MSHEPDVIFTYGTLRPGLGERAEAHAFRAEATLIGPATFQGKLYAIDWYPGVIDSSDPLDVVIGDLFKVGQKPDFFEKACEQAGQALTLRRHDGYDHSYYFIASFIDDHLEHHFMALSA